MKQRVAFFATGEVGDYLNHEVDRFTAQDFDDWIAAGCKATGIDLKYSAAAKKEPSKEGTKS